MVDTGAATRDRYFDALRATAIARVVIYHMYPVAALSLVFPAMGVMFALGGSLMARSLDRSAALDRSATSAVTSRLRRLLPAVWVMGALLVPAMIWVGWTDHPAWARLLLWLVPLVQPPASPWAEELTGALWYLVTYLWLVLLSPAALRLYRRWPVPTVVLPIAALIGVQISPWYPDNVVGSALTDLLTFAACWLLGFAHRDGSLRRMALPTLVGLAVAGVAFGLGWTLTHPGEHGFDVADTPVAYGVYSLGFVLVLLRLAPRMDWLARRRMLDWFVTVVNSRAVTIYLWHNAAITGSFVVGDSLGVWRMSDAATLGYFCVALVLLAAMVLLLGWVEDLAARRPARLLPRPVRAVG